MTPEPALGADKEPLLLTVPEVAARWRLSDETIHRWAREGRLPYVDVLGIKRFRRSDVEAIERGDSAVSGAA
jgi:excisionase family DNA binding protein